MHSQFIDISFCVFFHQLPKNLLVSDLMWFKFSSLPVDSCWVAYRLNGPEWSKWHSKNFYSSTTLGTFSKETQSRDCAVPAYRMSVSKWQDSKAEGLPYSIYHYLELLWCCMVRTLLKKHCFFFFFFFSSVIVIMFTHSHHSHTTDF